MIVNGDIYTKCVGARKVSIICFASENLEEVRKHNILSRLKTAFTVV